jgi:cation diffusion facilitator family transporter
MDIKVKFGFLALLIILIQSSIKLFGVLITGSLSFLSETVDTLTDIFFVSLTIFALHQSQKPPDIEHMYGHSKIDSVGAMIQGIILINVYVFLIINAINSILSQSYGVVNADIGFVLILVSFGINLIFSRYLMFQGKKRGSLALRIQGLNLFQDAMRAVFVIINFFLVLFFNLKILDPYFSIALSIWIIISAYKLSREGVKNLIDVNPIDIQILENLKSEIAGLEHVISVQDLKVRASDKNLFLELNLLVEDHISIVHANEISKFVRELGRQYFPIYNVEAIIEMNPLPSEPSLSDTIINLLYSIKSEFSEISEVKDLNIFRVEQNYFVSLSIVVDENLTLTEAHDISNNFETQLKEQVPKISKIITHIEAKPINPIPSSELICTNLEPKDLTFVKDEIAKVLKLVPEVKDFHKVEVWNAFQSCTLELHILFDGNLNISKVHDLISTIEQKLKKNLSLEKLREIIIHSEPVNNK